ncbi:hypothetical protein RB195_020865 [Necator americanus]|uniref:SAP domain-containing protein n=1 Tax=Necator americanus TaxID=51031 RepID=A0ABR1CLS1_NECAM
MGEWIRCEMRSSCQHFFTGYQDFLGNQLEEQISHLNSAPVSVMKWRFPVNQSIHRLISDLGEYGINSRKKKSELTRFLND